MFSAPDNPTADRMRTAKSLACTALGVRDTAQNAVWGYNGRTLSGTTGKAGAQDWLRLVSEPVDRAQGKLWDGPKTAQDHLPDSIPRPALHRIYDWQDDGHAYRAELYEHTALSTVSSSPVLDAELNLPEPWWKELHHALDTLAVVPTDRVAVREEYIRRAVPEYTGHDVGDSIEWSTSHGDFHWANLTGPELKIFDWEGWGIAPVGWDAAQLYVYALQAQETAARVRHVLAPILDDPRTRAAELTVCAQILQAADRTPFYAALAEPVRRHLHGVESAHHSAR
ncbi:hypothetical protein [Streptomyces graminilatus]|uniref:hypothetical protein n=1 Tax=Streptomyces graminilatus TaxID=1464070 RepID=UPI0006E2F29F|nr:hypothetical protein [Streptomyces graminilatus]